MCNIITSPKPQPSSTNLQGELAAAEARCVAGQRALAEAADDRRALQAELGDCRDKLAEVCAPYAVEGVYCTHA